MAVSNSLAGIRNGARQVEGTINGVGERAGNAALEEIVMAIRTRADFFGVTTGIDTHELHRTSRLVLLAAPELWEKSLCSSKKASAEWLEGAPPPT